MTMRQKILEHLRRTGRDEAGAVLVEFALVFPVMLIFFAVVIEGTRMLNSYMIAVDGVREASRYLARIAPVDICQTGGTLSGYNTTLKTRVESSVSGGTILLPLVTVNSVSATHTCVSGTYRIDPVPVATVTANMTINFPYGNIFSLFGTALTSVTTNATDRARIFGT